MCIKIKKLEAKLDKIIEILELMLQKHNDFLNSQEITKEVKIEKTELEKEKEFIEMISKEIDAQIKINEENSGLDSEEEEEEEKEIDESRKKPGWYCLQFVEGGVKFCSFFDIKPLKTKDFIVLGGPYESEGKCIDENPHETI